MSRVQWIRVGGQCNCYLVGSDGAYVLVDAGVKGFERRFFRGLERKGIAPEEIRLIVITHVHFDHVGCLAAIQRTCGCPVMVHEKEAANLRDGVVVIPPGSTPAGKVISWLGQRTRGLFAFEPVDPAVTISEPTSLMEWGLDARVVPTPGHTDGSVSLLLPEGEACVGDLMANCMLVEGWCLFPPFANDVPALYRSWEMLLKAGVHTFYPAHGRPISAGTVRRDLDRGVTARRRAIGVPVTEEA